MSSIHFISYIHTNFPQTQLSFILLSMTAPFVNPRTLPFFPPITEGKQQLYKHTANVESLSLKFFYPLHLDVSEFRPSLGLSFLLDDFSLDTCFLTPSSAFSLAAFSVGRLTPVFQYWSLGGALSLALKLVLSLQVTHSTGYWTLLPTKSNTSSIH